MEGTANGETINDTLAPIFFSMVVTALVDASIFGTSITPFDVGGILFREDEDSLPIGYVSLSQS